VLVSTAALVSDAAYPLNVHECVYECKLMFDLLAPQCRRLWQGRNLVQCARKLSQCFDQGGRSSDALVVLARPEPVDALFVDIVLNGDMQAGIELAKRAVELKPGLKVVYSTGLTLTDRAKASLVPGAVILEKPYTLDQLLTSLRAPTP
jgi:two-component SAPR family response regulator